MKAKRIWFENNYIFVETTTNKSSSMPLSWFKKLQNASEIERLQFELWDDGGWIHWEKLGEDLSVDGFFTFKKDFEFIS